jgi:hypothetical protein
MLRFQSLAAVVLGLGALSLGMGCAPDADDDDTTGEPELVESDRIPQGGPPGTGTTNKFLSDDFQDVKPTGYESTRSPIGTYGSNQWWVANNAATTTLLGSEAGRDFIKYAARCALPATVALHAQVGATLYKFPGSSLLTTTTGWLTTSLTASQTNDLFTCLVAHLNAFGVEVPINVSGPNIKNTEGADSGFKWYEALWVAKITATNPQEPEFELNVWPLDDLIECNGFVPQLEDRVCGTFAGDCGVVVRGDRNTACEETESGWYCTDTTGHSMPAIMTRLKETDVELMYDNCP